MMGKVETFEGVRASELSADMRGRLGLDSDALVKVTVEVQTSRRRSVDEAKLKAILARIDALPVLDDRPADEVLGYNEYGHFD